MAYHTRIAPSPTGFMHIGTARTAYLNYLAATASGGTFNLRIDDTDTDREVPGAVDVILNSLSWLGLNYDPESVIYQSQRHDVYTWWAQRLLSIGAAKELDNGAVALVWHDYMPRSWYDTVSGDMTISDKEIEQINGLILLKGGDKRGHPIYHFASVVDDWNRINYIIRGTDHISNTGKQLAIWAAMNCYCEIMNEKARERDPNGHFQTPVAYPLFSHVGLIHKNKRKISKRDGVTDPTIFLSYYQENDYEPEAVLNFLARMGWGPTVDDKSTTLLPRDRMTELFFNGGKMRSAPANFDMDKLNSFNRKYKAIREKGLV